MIACCRTFHVCAFRRSDCEVPSCAEDLCARAFDGDLLTSWAAPEDAAAWVAAEFEMEVFLTAVELAVSGATSVSLRLEIAPI